MDPTYAEYIDHLAHANPAFQELQQFLSRVSVKSETRNLGKAQFACIQYSQDGSCCRYTSSESVNIDSTIAEIDEVGKSRAESAASGAILMIEDITPALIIKLGATFNIDPLFFAGYLGNTFRNVEEHPPPLYITLLPSQIVAEDYINLHYHRPVKLAKTSEEPQSVPLDTISNVPRAVKQLAPLNGVQISMIRACCGVLRKRLVSGSWLCLILVDATEGDVVLRPKPGRNTVLGESIPQVPLFDAKCNLPSDNTQFSDFVSSKWTKRPQYHSNPSLFKILEKWFRNGSSEFSPADPSMLSLCYHPFRAVLADWLVYSIAMSRYVKHYEYSTQHLDLRLREEDISELQIWRRRASQSSQKLRIARNFVEHWISEEQSEGKLGPKLLKDIDYISGIISAYSNNLETTIPVITSMVQLLDARRSLVEAVGVKRLTYLALVFIPLSYVASLFSMAEKWSPGAPQFWLYFAVAIPLLVLVFGVVQISTYVAKCLQRPKAEILSA